MARALQQHRRIGRRDALDRLRDADDRSRFADDGRQAVALLELLFEQQVLVPQLAMLAAAPQKEDQVIDVERLLDEIEGAELHRLDRVLDRAERGHHDHRTLGIALLRLFQHGDAVGAGKAQIGDHGEVAAAAGEPAHGLAAGRGEVGFQPFRLDGFLEHQRQRLLVLDDEQPFHACVKYRDATRRPKKS